MTYQIQFLGVGSAFTLPLAGPDGARDLNRCDWQSNLLVTAESGKRLLLDCGSDIRFSLAQLGFGCADIDAVYISHLHADHTGGLEGVAFGTYFLRPQHRVKLHCSTSLTGPLWNQSLRGGLDSIEGKKMTLNDYFDVRPVHRDGHFEWEKIHFDLIQVVHVVANRSIKSSFGLMIREVGAEGLKVFWTSDTQFSPKQIRCFYDEADLILHDCETSPFKSGVHAHYDDLQGLDSAVKAKMHLYHYQPGAPQQRDAKADGFAGFVMKHQVFAIGSRRVATIVPRAA